jgi:hypothetical protein
MRKYIFNWGYSWSMKNTFSCYANDEFEAEDLLFENCDLDRGDFWKLV